MAYVRRYQPPYEKMRRLIRGYGLNAPKLASVLDCGETKARSLLRDRTAHLTLEDLHRLNTHGHIPIEEIREALQR